MADIDITSIARHGKKLYNAPEESTSASSLLSAAKVREVYSRGWIKQQRAALKRRLGSETAAGRPAQHRRDVAAATKFISTKELLQRTDVVAQEGSSSVNKSTRSSSSVKEEGEGSERETWFVRLFRYMVTG